VVHVELVLRSGRWSGCAGLVWDCGVRGLWEVVRGLWEVVRGLWEVVCDMEIGEWMPILCKMCMSSVDAWKVGKSRRSLRRAERVGGEGIWIDGRKTC
jgi:hypothetical protein